MDQLGLEVFLWLHLKSKENPYIDQMKRYINLKASLLSFADRGDKTMLFTGLCRSV